ncbi:hypothetical protein [Burkholderia vietnamiensis]|uniref:hypothetical protein n=1 Tax=Burkholderia vietnamiensis TaxID=60552 RepID=UPI000D8520BA|nr:hypothetical protein [Burkholderia vietnamiensis]GBH26109.1 hypothetical protein BvRS1_31580 [Burkholderia vietnamiensis]
MAKRLLLLVKFFDREEYARRFLEYGEMYCRPLADFKSIEDGDVRGDRYEAVSHWLQPKGVKIEITPHTPDGMPLDTIHIKESDLAGPVVSQLSIYDNLNLFCLHAVSYEEFEERYETEEERVLIKERINKSLIEQTTVPDQCAQFGEHAVLIHDVGQFFDRIKAQAARDGVGVYGDFVEYFNADEFNGGFNGVDSIFRKRDDYSYQKEYRLAFNFRSSLPQARMVGLGSLKDVAVIVPAKDLNGLLKIEVDG